MENWCLIHHGKMVKTLNKMNSFWEKVISSVAFYPLAEVLTENFLWSCHLIQKADFEVNENFQQISALCIKCIHLFFPKPNMFLKESSYCSWKFSVIIQYFEILGSGDKNSYLFRLWSCGNITDDLPWLFRLQIRVLFQYFSHKRGFVIFWCKPH